MTEFSYMGELDLYYSIVSHVWYSKVVPECTNMSSLFCRWSVFSTSSPLIPRWRNLILCECQYEQNAFLCRNTARHDRLRACICIHLTFVCVQGFAWHHLWDSLWNFVFLNIFTNFYKNQKVWSQLLISQWFQIFHMVLLDIKHIKIIFSQIVLYICRLILCRKQRQ